MITICKVPSSGNCYRFHHRHTTGRELVLSPEVPPEIKLGDCHNDLRLGAILREPAARHFDLPD